MRKLIYLLVILCFSTVTSAQIDNPPDLQRSLEGKKNFNDIVNTVHNYYDGELARLSAADSIQRKKIKRQLKMWFRWEFFNRGRLEPNGDITNVTQKDFAAIEELNNNPSMVPDVSYGIWTGIGPTAYTRQPGGHNGGLGRVNCIAFHPSDANTLWVGAPAGGLWKSTNGGTSWNVLTDDIPSIGVSGICVNPSNTNIIYILTGDGDGNDRPCLGVMKTTDGGDHWFFTGDFPSTPAAGFRGYKLIMHPTNSNILLAATDQGIFKTTNGGSTWTEVQATGSFSDIEFKPGSPTVMYAARFGTSTPFYRSTNTGDTWSTAGITGVPTNSSRIAIGVSENNPVYVYIFAGPATGVGTYVGVYRSFDSGLDFDLRNSAPNTLGYPVDGMDDRHQTTYDLAIEVDPDNEATVITAGINCWRSTNFGVTFTNATEWYEPSSPVAKYVHADIHNLAYNPLNHWLYVCSDGGVSVSTDNGQNWSVRWNTLQLAMYYTMSNYAADQNYILGGLQDNGTMLKRTASLNFDHIEGADGYQTIIDYSDPDILFFDSNDDLNWSTDGGITVNGAGLSGGSWPGLAMNTSNHNVVYAGRSDGVWRRNFSSGGWVNTGGAGRNRMLTCPSNSNRIYAYDNGTLRRSDDETGSWAPAGPPTDPPGGQNITDMAVNPGNSLDLYVCVGGYTAGVKVYHSTNGGATWTNLSGTLPNAACGAIAVDAALGVYVGTDIGVFYRASGGVWVPFYNFLPKVPITDLYINESASTISASTYGRGLWRTDLHTDCAASLVLSGTAQGNRFYEVSSTLVSTHTIEGGEGTEIFYKSGGYVRLDPGFEIKAGNKLKAFIGSCGTGIPTFRMLNNTYGITDSKELIKEPIDIATAGIVKGTLINMQATKDGREVSFDLPEDRYVQLYYERESDHEIVAWILKERIKKGTYKILLTDDKLKNKGIKLVITAGEESKKISL